MKYKWTILQILFTVTLLAVLLARSDPGAILALLFNLKPVYLLLVFALIFLDNGVRAYNWGWVLRIRGIRLPWPHLLYAHMVGGFFGTLFPSSLSVEVGRGTILATHFSVRAEETALTILMVNLLNLMALCVFALVNVLLFHDLLGNDLLSGSVLLFCLAFFVGFAVLLYRGGLPRLPGLSRAGLLARLWARLGAFVAAFRSFRHHKGRLAVAAGLSLVSQVINILVAYWVAVALQLDISIGIFAVLMPLINLSRVIPLSIAGLGAEQGFFVFLFALVGISAAAALSVSVVLSGTIILFSAIGGGIYLADKLGSLVRATQSAAD